LNRPISPELDHFVEEMALRYEDEGFPPMAGRLAGWLLVCDPPWQTAGELADVLGASPGSISTMTRMLIQCGLVERVAVPGQRVAAFQMKTGAAREVMAGWQEKTEKMRELLRRGLALLEGESEERKQRLLEQLEFHEFIERTLPELLSLWDRREQEGKDDE
jgi:DNA-binding transcriptional regulator GbsR (MarR family)